MTTMPRASAPAAEPQQAAPASQSGLTQPAYAGVPADGDFLVLDSCHSTWLFDVAGRRFRRALKGLDVDPSLAATDWRPYERLELSEGSEAFVVILNPAGTRRIRSWRHVDGCEQCEGERTSELSLEDLRRLSNA
ncbi:MAG: hypothetical protein ACLQK4_04905 [Acidimicrobiales bacterium]|jgi:hypothetical protein